MASTSKRTDQAAGTLPEPAAPGTGTSEGVRTPVRGRPALRPLRVLHLHLSLGQQSCANQFCLDDEIELGFVSFLEPRADLPAAVRLFAGDGTFRGFARALKRAASRAKWDIVHAHGPIDGVAYLLLRRWLQGVAGAKLVFTMHNCFGNFRLRNKLLLIPLFRAADRVVCCGRASMESVPFFFRRLAGTRLTAVPNGVNLARVHRAPPVPASAGFTAISVGRLIPIKDPVTVLRAFERLTTDASGARLEILGDGPLRPDLEDRSRSLNSSVIRLRGLVPRDEVYGRLKGASVFISASRGEGLPLAALEAMAASCPVVLSDIPSHREIAESAPEVRLVEPGDVEGFADELDRLRTMGQKERRRIGSACREAVERAFDIDGMLARYRALYRDLANSGSDGSGGSA